MTGYAPGDLRESASIASRIDHLIGAAELARELGDYKTAGEQITAAVYLHRVLRRLEKAVTMAEAQRARETTWSLAARRGAGEAS